MPNPCRKSRSDCELLLRRRGVHAIHHRLVQALQFLGGRDVGEDHELLDQPVAVEARPWRDAAHDALVVQHDTALRQVEIERAARGAGGEQGTKRRIQMCMPGVARVVRLLQALVGKACGAAHQAAAEAMGGLSAVRVNVEFDEQTAAILVRAQAAPAVGQRLGQHRHDAVGEIDAVAAGARRVVERRSRADVMRDIGDRDDEAEAPGEPESSGSANTASSKSRASSPSMVTSGRSRRSVRRPSGVARAVSASSSAAGGNSCGMSWVWMAIRLMDRASPTAPSRSMTRAGFRPRRAWGSGSASTISPSTAPPAEPGGTSHSALERRSVGTMRPR